MVKNTKIILLSFLSTILMSCDINQPLDPTYYCLNSSGQTVALVCLRELPPNYELQSVDSVIMHHNDKHRLADMGFAGNPFHAQEVRVYFNDELAFTYDKDSQYEPRNIRNVRSYHLLKMDSRRRGASYTYTYIFTKDDYQRFLDGKTDR